MEKMMARVSSRRAHRSTQEHGMFCIQPQSGSEGVGL
jgi:hypothetical protein